MNSHLRKAEKQDSAAFFDNSESPTNVSQEWLTTEQAADYLGLSVASLRNMTSNGQVPYYKLGNRNRYRLPELRQLLLSGKRGSHYGY
jgi:excisionase family DNA binding protein